MDIKQRRMKNLTTWKNILVYMTMNKMVFTQSSYGDVNRLRSYFDCGSLNEWIEEEVEDMLAITSHNIVNAITHNLRQ